MIAIRLQRVGRRGLAHYRLIVQDSRFHPTREKIIARVGSYDPHAKTAAINKEQIEKYLNNGAQPSDRVVRILVKEGVKMPKWVKMPETNKAKTLKNADKLRRNVVKEEVVADEPEAETEVAEAAVAEEVASEETAAEETTEVATEA
jgi:small subunit ribosomal protein S16